jgi:hypothetical protein
MEAHSEIGKSIELDNDGEERGSCPLRHSEYEPFSNEVLLYRAAVVKASNDEIVIGVQLNM